MAKVSITTAASRLVFEIQVEVEEETLEKKQNRKVATTIHERSGSVSEADATSTADMSP